MCRPTIYLFYHLNESSIADKVKKKGNYSSVKLSAVQLKYGRERWKNFQQGPLTTICFSKLLFSNFSPGEKQAPQWAGNVIVCHSFFLLFLLDEFKSLITLII